jgi:hypothetical protein
LLYQTNLVSITPRERPSQSLGVKLNTGAAIPAIRYKWRFVEGIEHLAHFSLLQLRLSLVVAALMM